MLKISRSCRRQDVITSRQMIVNYKQLTDLLIKTDKIKTSRVSKILQRNHIDIKASRKSNYLPGKKYMTQ
ncbi:hypothetical protein DSUL_40054 [Desulfovibrionales bacterium]